MDKILVYLSLVYNGDWNKIYNAVLNKEEINKENMKIELSKL